MESCAYLSGIKSEQTWFLSVTAVLWDTHYCLSGVPTMRVRLNVLLEALSKKCHGPRRASQFPEASPVKSALHCTLHTPHTCLRLLSAPRVDFLSSSISREELSESALFDPSPLLSPQKHSSNKCVSLTKSDGVATDLPRLCVEKSR